MNVFPTLAKQLPLRQGYGVELGTGVTRHPMSGAHARRERGWLHLPMDVRATWAVTRAERATLVDFLDAVGVAEFWVPLRVPGDPRAWRSVLARWASGFEIGHLSPSHDTVAAALTVLHVPIVLDFGGLLTPGGDDALAPDGSPANWEVLA
ncbi:hypothetical protein [Albimonas pacifica]|uniref:Uncharacterized protein n=1 Tax=Albimonas pacifica TaxID=1114924 RepID=A0A1I3HHW1_9RHOB|nr:hypothetical protein [Albimonas pacifica]SFI35272.1 hypothetical protein SAMN05216258_1062 [Albimonas pacifica]